MTDTTNSRVFRAETMAEAAFIYVRDVLERLAAVTDVPTKHEDGSPRANFYLVDDIMAGVKELKDRK